MTSLTQRRHLALTRLDQRKDGLPSIPLSVLLGVFVSSAQAPPEFPSPQIRPSGTKLFGRVIGVINKKGQPRIEFCPEQRHGREGCLAVREKMVGYYICRKDKDKKSEKFMSHM